jgi:small subunit ribosomal protein S10e
MMIMKSLASKGYVKYVFNWQWFYYYLTDEGIEELRKELHLPKEVSPATLTKPRHDVERNSDGDRKGGKKGDRKGKGKGKGGWGRGKGEGKGEGKGKGYGKGYGGEGGEGGEGYSGKGEGKGGYGEGEKSYSNNWGESAPAPAAEE